MTGSHTPRQAPATTPTASPDTRREPTTRDAPAGPDTPRKAAIQDTPASPDATSRRTRPDTRRKPTAQDTPGERVVVVGAGIAGLAAAYELQCAGVEAVVLEASGRPGGKIDSSQVAGLTVDSGPDGFVARDPAAADLCRRIGLGDDLVAPASRGAYVWVGGRMRPLPAQSLLGVPWTADAVAGTGIVSERGTQALRRGLDHDNAALTGDATVGEVLRPRVGDEVFEHLVDPLLGGINAGSADDMSIAACAPLLYEAVCRGGPLGAALQAVAAQHAGTASASPAATPSLRRQQGAAHRGRGHDEATNAHRGHDEGAPAPVFLSVRGGVTRIVDALAAELGTAVNLGTTVQSLSRAPGRGARRWRLTTPSGRLDADAVILACPAWESARLLEPLAAEAAGVLAAIEYSDVVLTTFAIRSERLGRPLDASGYLVPRNQGLLTTACSWASSKWRHYAHEEVAVLRVSAGRTDDRRWLDLAPDELVSTLAAELAATGLISPTDASQRRFGAQVTPWRRSLPQYRPGHLERIARAHDCLAAQTPGLAVAGAALVGVGLPACIRSGGAAAASVMHRP